MFQARNGDRVRVQYLGLLSDGKPVTGSRRREVLDFTVGSQEVIPGISRAVVGMAQGEEKRVSLTATDAFGIVNPRLIKEVPKRRFPDSLALHVGQRLMAIGERSGRRRRVRVVELRPDSVVVDANHPLAGEVVEVELLLVALRSKTVDT